MAGKKGKLRSRQVSPGRDSRDWRSWAPIVGIIIATIGLYFTYASLRPYVLSESAFWRNDFNEAVVEFSNSGKLPAYEHQTQIHFVATTDKSANFKLDWDH